MTLRRMTGVLLASAAILALPTAAGFAAEGPKPQQLSFGGGPTGSGVYAIVATLSTMIEKKLPGSQVTTVEGGTVSNAVRVIQGQLQMAYSKPATTFTAQKGLDKRFSKPSTVIKSVFGITGGPVHIVVAKDTGIRSFQTIVEKKTPLKWGGGGIGESSEVFLRQILGFYGLTYDDLKSWGGQVRLVPMNEGLEAFKDGQLNAQITPSNLPHSGIVELSGVRAVQLVSLGENVIKALGEKYGYARGVIPAGMYKGTDYEVSTLDDPYIVVARADVPDDFVYWLTKTVMSAEGRKTLGAVSKELERTTPAQSFEMLGVTEIHEGAKRYWREVGLLKP